MCVLFCFCYLYCDVREQIAVLFLFKFCLELEILFLIIDTRSRFKLIYFYLLILLLLFYHRKTPRIKTDKARTSKRFNQQNASIDPLTTDSITTAFSQTKLSNGQPSSTPTSTGTSADTNLDERLEKKRRERELYVFFILIFYLVQSMRFWSSLKQEMTNHFDVASGKKQSQNIEIILS